VQIDYSSPSTILSGIIWLLIILVIAQSRYTKNSNEPHYRYYMLNIYFKLLFAFVFACVYIFYYGGGDTLAYWDGANKLANLFFKSPALYFEEMNLHGGAHSMMINFDLSTGYPPGWIYREPEGWFVSKIFSVFSFITLKSYWAATFLIAFLFANVSWKLYEMVRSFKIHRESHAALAVLFIPSVSFWCAGISKDTIVLISIFYLVIHMFRIISWDLNSSWKDWLGIMVFTYVVLHTRSALIMAVFSPLLFAYTARIRKKYIENKFAAFFISAIVLILGMGAFGYFLYTQGHVLQGYIEEASVVQQDFAKNTTYGTNRYDIGITDYSPIGLLRAFPAAVLAGTFRPFLWEALSPTLIMNGLESIFMMYLTLLFFFKGSVMAKINQIRRSELLIFSFYFVLLMAFTKYDSL
jgi:hypothetical protein